MPGFTGTNIGGNGTAGVQRRGVDGGDQADEVAPVPSALMSDVVKELLKNHKTK